MDMVVDTIMTTKNRPARRSSLPCPPAADAYGLSPATLLRLLTWLSPAYPIGAFSFSSGIEWAVELGDISNAESLRDWLEATLTEGSGLNDGIFLAAAYRATAQSDTAALAAAAELAAAFVPTRERHLETTTLGRAFLDITRTAWPCAALASLQEHWDGPLAYPIAVGVACAGHDIPLAPALQAYMTAVVSNWISAGVRLIPLGHTDSQRVLKALEPAVATTAQRAVVAGLDDLGGATFRADIASIRHETQYTRLFRS